ncbi:MAG: methyltransferase [Candidatus Aminicenantes bacterium]|nr:methyltransferase [Candidatus Aminicenantes bacterium]
MNKLTSPEALMQLVYLFRPIRIILTAFELDVFSVIGEKTMTSREIAKRTKTNTKGMDRLLNALCAPGLLTKRKGKFANTPLSKKYLVSGGPDFLAGLGHSVDMWDSWSTLTQAVIHGKTVIKRGPLKREGKRLSGFIAAMDQRASAQAAETVKRLDLTGVRRTLDIGGGSGAYSIALALAKKDLRATVFDLPNVIPLTRAYVRKSKVAARIDFVEGDFHRGGFGSGYDLILVSAVIHMNSLPENLNLLKKVVRALNPGGQLVIQDYIMSEDRTKPEQGAFFALNMLTRTEAGDAYTEREVRELMKEAGLSRIARIKIPFATALIVGKNGGLCQKRRPDPASGKRTSF